MHSIRALILIFLMGIGLQSANGQTTCGNIAIPEKDSFEENSFPRLKVYKDTISNPDNIWEIGVPQKQHIDSAYSAPNSIITGVTSPYPLNDTSSFIIETIDEGGWSMSHSAELSGKYFVNSDSLNDYGLIELSADSGDTWVNLVDFDDTLSFSFNWWSPKPVLTGNSNGWIEFYLSFPGLGDYLNIKYSDTVLLRFSFISDNKEGSYDGLAFDDLLICNWFETSIHQKFSNNSLKAYYDPVRKKIIAKNSNVGSIIFKIYDNQGKLVLHRKINQHSELVINSGDYLSGIYFTVIKNIEGKKLSSGKFVIFD